MLPSQLRTSNTKINSVKPSPTICLWHHQLSKLIDVNRPAPPCYSAWEIPISSFDQTFHERSNSSYFIIHNAPNHPEYRKGKKYHKVSKLIQPNLLIPRKLIENLSYIHQVAAISIADEGLTSVVRLYIEMSGLSNSTKGLTTADLPEKYAV